MDGENIRKILMKFMCSNKWVNSFIFVIWITNNPCIKKKKKDFLDGNSLLEVFKERND